MRKAGEGPNGPLQGLYRLWGIRYLSWIHRLFITNSTGGGEWEDLADSTIVARRNKNKKTIKILIDTGMLLRALSIGNPGNRFEFIRYGVRVGFGGPARHPDGKATILDIAKFHQTGGGNLPARPILHEPDKDFIDFMVVTASAKLKRLLGGRE
jgi:hypothetical protein